MFLSLLSIWISGGVWGLWEAKILWGQMWQSLPKSSSLQLYQLRAASAHWHMFAVARAKTVTFASAAVCVCVYTNHAVPPFIHHPLQNLPRGSFYTTTAAEFSHWQQRWPCRGSRRNRRAAADGDKKEKRFFFFFILPLKHISGWKASGGARQRQGELSGWSEQRSLLTSWRAAP